MLTGFLPVQEERLLRERLGIVSARLAKAAASSGRAADDIRLIAISKTHPAPALAALAFIWGNGVPTFGENYVQEAVNKQVAMSSLLCEKPGGPSLSLEWHFTGHLQSRKAKEVTGRFSLIHTLDSEKLANQIQKTVHAEQLPAQAVLVQINIGEEPQKSGIACDDAEALITAVMQMPKLSIQGLMCLPPHFGEAEISRPYFAKLRKLRDTLARATGLALPHLSMGMSHDCEVAVAEGATMVRIGTDIFGERPAKA